jgi:hypothetical protein
MTCENPNNRKKPDVASTAGLMSLAHLSQLKKAIKNKKAVGKLIHFNLLRISQDGIGF